MRRMQRTLSAVAAIGLVFCSAGTAAAQHVRPTANGISIHAEQTPLGAVLRELAGILTLDRLTIDPSVEQRLVTFTVEDVGVWTGVLRLLHAARVDYVLAMDAAGKSTRLAVVDLPENAAAAPVSIAVPSPVADADLDREQQAVIDERRGGDAAAQDAGDHAFRMQQLTQALSLPRVPLAPGSLIELPFPAADGGPLFATKPPDGTPVVLPVPDAPPSRGTSASPAGRPSTPTSDPQVNQLLESLVPGPR